jgi:DNA invertase Pin-like site-specific DNA recombinase
MRYFIYCRKSSEGEERQVLSLASQQEALAKAFGNNPDIKIAGVYEEAKSAKTPGRPMFAEMLQRIEAGEAEGIASWAPDRLARNSIDGGHIIYLLDRGVLKDLKFATYTFEDNPQGKFMLGIMFNQSKYYSDALSENVKRGNATKVKMGWRPNRPPLGYLNCTQTRTIIPDPVLFPLVRRIFDLCLSGAYTPREICLIATHEWGFLTPRKHRSGGKPPGRSTIYRMLSNPFYMGSIVWDGAVHPGRHKPLITPDEYERVQALLNRRDQPRPVRHSFAFAGLLSCGACGKAVTAERKVNRFGSRYVYYHCAARSRIAEACGERSIEEVELNGQFAAFVGSIALRPGVAGWARARLRDEEERRRATTGQIAASQDAALAEIAAQLEELTSLRLRRMVDDEEFLLERRRLEAARSSVEQARAPVSTDGLFELLDVAERISVEAAEWFERAEPEQKRRLLGIVCSNPVLKARKASIEAAKPFVIRSDLSRDLCLLGVVDDHRTITREGKRLLANLRALAQEGQVDATIDRFKELERLCQEQDCSTGAQMPSERARPSPARRQARSPRQNPPRKRG